MTLEGGVTTVAIPALETERLHLRGPTAEDLGTYGDTGEVVGGCGIAHPDDWPSHELTWWLMPAARGAGLATEASLATIRFGYDALGWPVVETHMRDENLPARRPAQRLGRKVIRRDIFPDGVARDVFALPHPDETMEGAA